MTRAPLPRAPLARATLALALALAASACAVDDKPNLYPQRGDRLAPPPAPAALCESGGQRDPDPNAPAGPGQGDPGAPPPQGGAGGAGGAGGGGPSWSDGGVGSIDWDTPPPDMEPDQDPPEPDLGPDLGPDQGEACEPGADPDDGVPGEPCEPDGGAPQIDGGAPQADGGAPPIETDTQGLCEAIDLSRPRVLYLSADDSNSMASPVLIRQSIQDGAVRFDPRRIRTYEFLNYARFPFERPPEGELALYGQLGGCDAGELALQIALVSADLPVQRPPMHLVLVLDTSGSMRGAAIDRLRDVVRAIAGGLEPGDKVSAVQWSDEQTPMLEGIRVDGPDDPRILTLADRLDANGGTNLSGGLRAGYAQAAAHAEPGLLTRVVLVSDGGANAGITDEALIGAEAEDEDGEGTYLVGVGVGDGRAYNDTLMDVVTDAGRGAYVFIDSPEEARHVFTERFDETLLVAARDVKVQLTLPPYFNIEKFFGEEYSPDPAKVRPQHLAPSDAMVFQQIVRACDPSLVRADHPVSVKVTWRDPATGAARVLSRTWTLGELTTHHPNLHKAAAIVAFAESLKQSNALDDLGLAARYRAVRAEIDAADPGSADADLNQLRALLDRMLSQLPEPVDTCGPACTDLAACAAAPAQCPVVTPGPGQSAYEQRCLAACHADPTLASRLDPEASSCADATAAASAAVPDLAAACGAAPL